MPLLFVTILSTHVLDIYSHDLPCCLRHYALLNLDVDGGPNLCLHWLTMVITTRLSYLEACRARLAFVVRHQVMLVEYSFPLTSRPVSGED